MMNKKAEMQIGKTVEQGAILVIIVVVLFLIYAALVPEAQSAGDSMSDDAICTNAGCIINTSLTPDCQSNRSPQGFGDNSSAACAATLQTIPLASLFGGSGIVFLIIMVALLLTILKTVLPSKGKK